METLSAAFHAANRADAMGSRHSERLEKVCVETVESGFMTRDRVIVISADQPWMSRGAFPEKLDEKLQKAMA